MQLSEADERLRRMARVLAALLLALGLMLSEVPVGRVAACDCAVVELPDAVREADVAFVGRLAEHRPGGDNFGFPVEDEWVFTVERSRDPGLASSLTVIAELGDGANCGVFFGAGERWLIVASAREGELHTNGCWPNVLVDQADPETKAMVAELVSAVVVASGAPAGPSLPTPILIVIGVASLLAAAGILAFRRDPTST